MPQTNAQANAVPSLPPVQLQMTTEVSREGPAGYLTPAWRAWFNAVFGTPGAIAQLTPGVSPYTYMPNVPGFALIIGGTVSNLALIRGRVTIASLGFVAGFVPLSLKDQLVVTYSVVPTMWFVPR